MYFLEAATFRLFIFRIQWKQKEITSLSDKYLPVLRNYCVEKVGDARGLLTVSGTLRGGIPVAAYWPIAS